MDIAFFPGFQDPLAGQLHVNKITDGVFVFKNSGIRTYSLAENRIEKVKNINMYLKSEPEL